jgi:hypothetical protein
MVAFVLAGITSTCTSDGGTNMYVKIEIDTVPPTVTLYEPDDFKAFKIIVDHKSEMFVPQAIIRQLAGSRAGDLNWQTRFEAMIEYAAERGWTNDVGDIQAHVEVTRPE